jgi:hypothetical protein
MDFILGEKFKTIVTDKVFYVKTEHVNNFLMNPPKHEFILVSHNSDGKIIDYDYLHCANVKYIPKNLIRWFGQNVCVKNEKVESIPIGLENTEWFVEEKKIENIEYYRNLNIEFENLLYINHNINTNPMERMEPYRLFKDSKWATLVMGSNGSNFKNYIENVKKHKFVLCPEGNGTDTHRTWETLYVGSIPIEKRNINNSFYQDLPICFVDSWSEINEDFLNYEFDRIKNTKWNLDKLNFSYWKDKIINYSK